MRARQTADKPNGVHKPRDTALAVSAALTLKRLRHKASGGRGASPLPPQGFALAPFFRCGGGSIAGWSARMRAFCYPCVQRVKNICFTPAANAV